MLYCGVHFWVLQATLFLATRKRSSFGPVNRRSNSKFVEFAAMLLRRSLNLKNHQTQTRLEVFSGSKQVALKLHPSRKRFRS